MSDHYESRIAELEEELLLAENKIAALESQKPKTIYLMDDPECDLQHLQSLVPDAWILIDLEEYITEDGHYDSKPLFNIPIILRKISEQ